MEGLEKQDWVFVGLGNPGKKYEMTRHNVGNMTVQALAQRLGLSLKEEKRFKGLYAKGNVNGSTVHLLLPNTYMNLSGEAVRKTIDFYKLNKTHIVVVVDDADLPFGKICLREQGSSGGHNGLKSIETHMGTKQYIRLRMGIGRNTYDQSLVGHVLNNFNKEEIAELPEFVGAGVESLIRLTQEDFNMVMNAVNASQKDLNQRPST